MHVLFALRICVSMFCMTELKVRFPFCFLTPIKWRHFEHSRVVVFPLLSKMTTAELLFPPYKCHRGVSFPETSETLFAGDPLTPSSSTLWQRRRWISRCAAEQPPATKHLRAAVAWKVKDVKEKWIFIAGSQRKRSKNIKAMAAEELWRLSTKCFVTMPNEYPGSLWRQMTEKLFPANRHRSTWLWI